MKRQHGVVTVSALAGAAILLAAGCAGPSAGKSDNGILVMAHGGDGKWNRDLEKVVAPLRKRYPVQIALGMAKPSTMEEAVRRLEAQGVRRVAVVRLFISGESFLPETEHILGLRSEFDESDRHTPVGHGHCSEPARTIAASASFALSTEGVADSPLIDGILADRVKSLSKEPARESVLILAHGPGDDAENERWLARMRSRASAVRRLGQFREVRCETLREDWPDKREPAEERVRRFVRDGAREGGRVIVVPFRIAGFGPYKEVFDGLEYIADGQGFCPHPNMTRWIEQTALTSLREPPDDRQARLPNQAFTGAE